MEIISVRSQEKTEIYFDKQYVKDQGDYYGSVCKDLFPISKKFFLIQVILNTILLLAESKCIMKLHKQWKQVTNHQYLERGTQIYATLTE